MADAAEIARRLGIWLGAHLAHFRMLDSGWETTIFEFAIAARAARDPSLPVNAPLVLRLYEGPDADDKAARESRTIFALAEAGYPVPRPYLFERDRDPLGAPILVMERAAGGPLFTTHSFPQAFKIFSLGFLAFVRAQARLHRLAARGLAIDHLPQGFICSPDRAPASAPLLDRMLGVIAERVARGPIPGLEAALAMLRDGAARFREAPAAIVHMDYHPQNVIVRGVRVTGVIDWVSADRGDRHLDAATTSAILATSAMERPNWMRDNRAGNTLRALFAGLYFPMYHALAPMDLARFRYCQAVAAVMRLSTFGMMRARGPGAVGYRPEAIANVIPDVVRLLTRYASRKTGVPVSIEPAV
ncbi:MAG: phosphotransferase [Candidatus Binataceae bacterium]|nr:phosphotransferase [Candidatus Binataceae bacterium]